jgi:hypothetical protein
LTPIATPSKLIWTRRSTTSRFAVSSRNAISSRNFQVVSTCSSGNGNGGFAGKNAFIARWSRTELSLPIEYSMTGRSHSATTSRMMWMLSPSRRWRWVSRDMDGPSTDKMDLRTGQIDARPLSGEARVSTGAKSNRTNKVYRLLDIVTGTETLRRSPVAHCWPGPCSFLRAFMPESPSTIPAPQDRMT